jgi:hypothetical protein
MTGITCIAIVLVSTDTIVIIIDLRLIIMFMAGNTSKKAKIA